MDDDSMDDDDDDASNMNASDREMTSEELRCILQRQHNPQKWVYPSLPYPTLLYSTLVSIRLVSSTVP